MSLHRSAVAVILISLAFAAPLHAQALIVEPWITDDIFLPNQLAWAPDGRLFVTELAQGDIHIVEDGTLITTPFVSIDVEQGPETGMIGVCFDNDFLTNKFVYCWYQPVGETFAKVTRFTALGNTGIDPVDLLTFPTANNHNGGNLLVGDDDKLYVTMGENNVPANAQDTTNVLGSVLRYNLDGTIPSDNPLGPNNPIWSYGLRNPWDIAFHPVTGGLYTGEVGPACDDELNKLIAGGNYGWRPNEPCGDVDPQYEQPLYEWNPVATPTGLTFCTSPLFPDLMDNLLVGIFNSPARIWRFELGGPDLDFVVSEEVLITNADASWVLDIAQGPDGYLYYTGITTIYRIIPATAGSTTTPSPTFSRFQLGPARPNPAVFGGPVTIAVELAAASRLRLAIHDAQGRRVRTITDRRLDAGTHRLTWDGRSDSGRPLASGVYFYEARTPGERQTQRVVLTR